MGAAPVAIERTGQGRSSAPARSADVPLEIRWLGRVAYRSAWTLQHELVAARAADDIPDQLLLLEHPAVITLGRHADASFVLADAADLARRGIEVIRTERGGEVTYHGPGQLVAYPIIRLADRAVLLRPFVRALEAAMAETCAALGVAAGRRDGFPGCWVAAAGSAPRKIGALGVRLEHGVTYHGIALNVTTNLVDFALIEACGLPGVTVTSVAEELTAARSPRRWPAGPSTTSVRAAADVFGPSFRRHLDAAATGPGPVATAAST